MFHFSNCTSHPLKAVPLLPLLLSSALCSLWCCSMALRWNCAVYVALSLSSLCALCAVCRAAGTAGAPGTISKLLPPYDALYYRGVRAYFSEDWEKAAEYIEQSIATREAHRRVRRTCHDQCSSTGQELVHKLGKQSYFQFRTGRLS